MKFNITIKIIIPPKIVLISILLWVGLLGSEAIASDEKLVVLGKYETLELAQEAALNITKIDEYMGIDERYFIEFVAGENSPYQLNLGPLDKSEISTLNRAKTFADYYPDNALVDFAPLHERTIPFYITHWDTGLVLEIMPITQTAFYQAKKQANMVRDQIKTSADQLGATYINESLTGAYRAIEKNGVLTLEKAVEHDGARSDEYQFFYNFTDWAVQDLKIPPASLLMIIEYWGEEDLPIVTVIDQRSHTLAYYRMTVDKEVIKMPAITMSPIRYIDNDWIKKTNISKERLTKIMGSEEILQALTGHLTIDAKMLDHYDISQIVWEGEIIPLSVYGLEGYYPEEAMLVFSALENSRVGLALNRSGDDRFQFGVDSANTKYSPNRTYRLVGTEDDRMSGYGARFYIETVNKDDVLTHQILPLHLPFGFIGDPESVWVSDDELLVNPGMWDEFEYYSIKVHPLEEHD